VFADSGNFEAPHRGSSYSQDQTDYGTNRRDERQSQPWHAGAAYGEDYRLSQDSYSQAEQRGYDRLRQAAYGRNEPSYERLTERSDYEGGHQLSYGRVETDERRHAYEQQNSVRWGRYGEDNPHAQRHEQQERREHADHSGRQRYGEEESRRSRRDEEESRRSYGGYSRPGDEYRYSERRQEYDGDTGTTYRGGDEYGSGSRYRESQESYPGGEYGRSGEEASRRNRDHYEGAKEVGYGVRVGAYGHDEDRDDTFGAERLDLNDRDEDRGGYSGQRGYGGYEQREMYGQPGAEY
jgi:hypothetical protein